MKYIIDNPFVFLNIPRSNDIFTRILHSH